MVVRLRDKGDNNRALNEHMSGRGVHYRLHLELEDRKMTWKGHFSIVHARKAMQGRLMNLNEDTCCNLHLL